MAAYLSMGMANGLTMQETLDTNPGRVYDLNALHIKAQMEQEEKRKREKQNGRF